MKTFQTGILTLTETRLRVDVGVLDPLIYDKAAQVLIQVVNSDNPPLRLVLGKYAYSKFRNKIESLTAELDAWEQIAASTDFETAPVR